MVVTFFGHRNAPESIKPVLKNTIEKLIEQRGADRFYVGNHGNFDRMVRSLLQEIQKEHPGISYFVVLSTLPSPIIGEDLKGFPTIVAEDIEKIHPKYRIVMQNRWLIEKADFVVTYVEFPFGGAAQFKKQAERKGKVVIELSDLSVI